jgi:prolyl oligopeptidase
MSKRTLLALTLTACSASRAAPPPPVPMHASAPASASSPTAAPATPPAAYPPSRTTDTSDTLFGTVVRDPYRWLEDGDSPEVKAWAMAQDAFARARLDRLPHRDAILARLEALDRAEARGWYLRRPGGRVFFTRRAADQDKWVVVVREANGSERTLIDPNAWPQEGNPSLVEHVVSPDGKKIAYGVSSNNADETTSHVLDVDTGKDLPDLLPGTNFFNVQFNSASDGLYYRYTPPDAKLDAGQRYGLGDLRFHRLGRAATEDVVVHESMRDPYNFLWIGASEDGHWLFATVDHSASILDVYFKDARGPQTSTGWRPLAVGGHASYDVTTYRDRFYVFTNDGASRSRVMVVDPKKPQRDAWKEIVPERADQTLTDVRIVGGKLALTYLEDVISHVEIHELDGRLVREIQAPGIGALSPLVGGMSKDDDTVFYGFESYTSPKELFQTSVRTGVTRSVYRATVPFDGAPYLVEQRFFASKDGTRVPMFILRKRDGDGGAPRSPAPTILYAYGAYGYSETPWFNAHIVPWLEQGGVYAIANVRGGAEYGEAWHQAVVGRGKQLTFDDFAAAAEFLTREGYTTPHKLVIKGGSHGGLLVATELTQRPELFRAVICEVPVIDMIRYTRFGAGKLWVGEIGSPTVEADFRALFAYSPYHHIVPGVAYPSILIASADSDDRVDPLHARKLAAALQGASNGGSVLLRVEHAASHRGSGRRSSNDAQLADEYAFALGEIAARGSVARAGR